MKQIAILAAALLAGSAAMAQDAPNEPDYLDNRSTAPELVKSLYNAIERKEYGRAWSYFGDEKPVATPHEFAKGYETTKSVKLLLGEMTSEGAAGSFYYSVPVAIAATLNDGKTQVFGGCYTVRLASPALQEVDFKPMHIVKGKLQPADGKLEAALPKKCEGG